MIDNDGSFDYSNIVTIRRAIKGFAVENVYPNPTSGIANLVYSSETADDMTFTIMDALSQTLTTIHTTAANGINMQPIDLSSLPVGVYFISVENNHKEKMVRRVVKE